MGHNPFKLFSGSFVCVRGVGRGDQREGIPVPAQPLS